MRYKVMLLVAFIGLVFYFFGYIRGSLAMQIGGGILVGSMFTIFMLRKLARR